MHSGDCSTARQTGITARLRSRLFVHTRNVKSSQRRDCSGHSHISPMLVKGFAYKLCWGGVLAEYSGLLQNIFSDVLKDAEKLDIRIFFLRYVNISCTTLQLCYALYIYLYVVNCISNGFLLGFYSKIIVFSYIQCDFVSVF